jgi:hypothetical protein
MVSDRDVSPSSVIASLPCEILEQVAFGISVGKDVVVIGFTHVTALVLTWAIYN